MSWQVSWERGQHRGGIPVPLCRERTLQPPILCHHPRPESWTPSNSPRPPCLRSAVQDVVETLLRTTALCDAHRNPRRGRLCRPRVTSKVDDEVEHPAVDGRYGVPELPRWNETPLPRLGMTADDLIPVSMKMHASNGKGINIIGAAILRFSGKSPYGEPRETQITYITDNSDKLFLSREACISLDMITARFPTVGEVISHSCPQLSYAGSTDETDIDTRLCGYPRRQKPPPVPTKFPYAAHGENRSKLQEYLLDYYSSSTFNSCEHQLLSMMQGPPLGLMVDPDAAPVAHHTPVPVPVHWQEEVKAGLDRDVRLGVIEPVPVGDPVTYCHMMVICAKNNGKQRRTVDMQSLNANATRETHHTQSPFHQARSIPAVCL